MHCMATVAFLLQSTLMHAVLILCGVKVHRLEVYDVMGMEAQGACGHVSIDPGQCCNVM